MRKYLGTGLILALVITVLGVYLGTLEAKAEEASVHPGDINTDWRMVLSEAIAYLAGWQQGSNPIGHAIRAAYLWQNGKAYAYDAGQTLPLCWVLADNG